MILSSDHLHTSLAR